MKQIESNNSILNPGPLLIFAIGFILVLLGLMILGYSTAFEYTLNGWIKTVMHYLFAIGGMSIFTSIIMWGYRLLIRLIIDPIGKKLGMTKSENAEENLSNYNDKTGCDTKTKNESSSYDTKDFENTLFFLALKTLFYLVGIVVVGYFIHLFFSSITTTSVIIILLLLIVFKLYGIT